MRALALLCALAAVASAQMDHGGHMGGMAMPSAAGPKAPCVEDPTKPECADFKLPHPVVQGDLNSLCKAMHFMSACSVYKACRALGPAGDADAVNGTWTAKVAADPDVCRRLNLVATVCAHDTGMGRMAGCQANYNSMCAAGSVVPLCKSLPGLAQLPTTKAVNQAVRELCTAKGARPGCAACMPAFAANKTYGDCDLLATWGDICAAEPKLPQCANHTALCAKDKTWFFCRGGAAATTAKGASLLSAAPSAAAAAGPMDMAMAGSPAAAAPAAPTKAASAAGTSALSLAAAAVSLLLAVAA